MNTTAKNVTVSSSIQAAFNEIQKEIAQLNAVKTALEAANALFRAPAPVTHTKVTVRANTAGTVRVRKMRKSRRYTRTSPTSVHAPAQYLKAFLQQHTGEFTTATAESAIRDRGWTPNPKVRTSPGQIVYSSLNSLRLLTGLVERTSIGTWRSRA